METFLPFQALLPYDNRILILDYEPLLPLCYEVAEESLTSDSDSDTDTTD